MILSFVLESWFVYWLFMWINKSFNWINLYFINCFGHSFINLCYWFKNPTEFAFLFTTSFSSQTIASHRSAYFNRWLNIVNLISTNFHDFRQYDYNYLYFNLSHYCYWITKYYWVEKRTSSYWKCYLLLKYSNFNFET